MSNKSTSQKNPRKARNSNAKVDARSVELASLERFGTFNLIGNPVHGLTDNQQAYLTSLSNKRIAYTFGTGDAGTGKTYCAVNYALELMSRGEIENLIISRPAVEAGEKLGSLPGEIEDKFAPYLEPVLDILKERLRPGVLDYLLKSGRIRAVPLAYCRGKTFKNSFVILDEAQNTTATQMKMFLTRLGEGSRMAVNGDISQQDTKGMCGLMDAVERVRKLKIVSVINFTRSDCVRSGAVGEILDCYA